MASMYERSGELFDRLVGLPLEEARAYLMKHVADEALREDVFSLLLAYHDDPDFLESKGSIFPQLDIESLGDYRIQYQVGSGGMGAVYLAEDPRLERYVAIKFMHPDLELLPEHRDRLEREARIAARLEHKGIVRVYDYRTYQGHPYLVTEYVPGCSLADILDTPEGAAHQTPVGAARICRQLAQALAYAHSKGVLHRDVKPGNVLISSLKGAIKLADFGLAKHLDGRDQTMTVGIVGTREYMSPEHLRGETLDARTDLFSVGVLLYRLLAGTTPFEDDPDKRTRPSELITSVPDTPPDLNAICRKLLELDRRDRYGSAEELEADLDRYLNGEPVSARPLSPAMRALRSAQRHPVRTSAALVVLLAAGLTTAELRRTTGHIEIAAETPRPAVALDLHSGTLASLGQAPTTATLEEGEYRILGELPDGTWSETWARVDRRGRTSIELPPANAPDSEMVLVDPSAPPLAGALSDEVLPPPFYLDCYEVSNAKFLAFLEATESDYWPALWPNPLPPEFADLPVAGVPFEQAQAYAAWCGKRLPTKREWEVAAQGPTNALYPWGGHEKLGGADLASVANVFRDHHAVMWKTSRETHEELRGLYAESVVPANALPTGSLDRSWCGALHMLGNVAEWTETEAEHSDQQRVVKGDHWGRDIDESYSLRSHFHGHLGNYALIGLGFRCAKTALDQRPSTPRHPK